MRARKPSIAIAVIPLVLFSGCDGPSEPSSEQRMLLENRTRFRTTVGTSYSYDYQNSVPE